MPRLMFFSVCWSIWNRISSLRPSSIASRRTTDSSRYQRSRIQLMMAPRGLQRRVEHEVDRARHPAPLRQLVAEVFAAGARQRVITGAPVVGGDAPFRGNQPLALEAVERGIERALSGLQYAFGPLLDAFGDPPAVHRLQLERF